MIKILNVVIIIIYIRGIWVFCRKRKHLLIVLLRLEYMVLITYLLLVNILRIIDYNIYLLIIYLVFVVCEGALRLGIIVAIIRSYGNDYFGLYCLLE